MDASPHPLLSYARDSRILPVESFADVTTLKFFPLLATLATMTITFPVATPAGTSTTMLAALQFVGVAIVPLNVTVLVPCIGPKFNPVIVTNVPTGPDAGDKLVICGAACADVCPTNKHEANSPQILSSFTLRLLIKPSLRTAVPANSRVIRSPNKTIALWIGDRDRFHTVGACPSQSSSLAVIRMRFKNLSSGILHCGDQGIGVVGE